jgi:hypothetical protein
MGSTRKKIAFRARERYAVANPTLTCEELSTTYDA